MPSMRELRHGLGLLRVEMLRSWRKLTESRRRIVLGAVFVLLFLPSVWIWVTMAHGLGERSAADGLAVAEVLAPRLGFLFAILAALELMRATRGEHPDGEDLLLTSSSPRAVSMGLALANAAKVLVPILVPLLVLSGAFALGADALTLLVTVPLLLVPLLVASSLLGSSIGHGLLLLGVRVPVLYRATKGIGFLAFLGIFFLGFDTAWRSTSSGPTIPTLGLPLEGYVDVMLLGSPLSTELGWKAATSLLVVVAAVPLLLSLNAEVQRRLLYAEPPGKREKRVGHRTGLSPRGPFSGSREGRVAWTLWVRSVRAPVRLSHLTFLLFFVAPVIPGIVLEGVVLGSVLIASCVGIAFSGLAFCLNPVGEEGDVMSVIVLSRAPGAVLVRGRALAGLVIGAPLAVSGVVVAAWVGSGSLPLTAAAALFAASLCLFSSASASAIGAFAPQFESAKAFGNVKVVQPRPLALVLFVFLLTVPGAVGATPLVLAVHGPLSIATGSLGAVMVSVVALGIGFGGYRYASGRLDSYTVD